METYIFTDDCIIGNDTIDNEHRNLFALINEANEAAMEGKADNAEFVKGLLESLADYANTHFAHEEAYMESINDPELTVQKMEHKAFINLISEELNKKITDDNAKDKLDELLKFSAKWLYHHILGSDTLIGTTVQSDTDANDDEMFDFTDKYLTGIDSIDDQHRRLFEIIASLHDAAEASKKGYDRYDFILETLAELKEYTETHFADEEEYMESINYAGLDAQRKAHRSFVERISKIELNELDENQEEYLANLTDFLIKWLSQHILKMDCKIHS